jgi:hypothetical protein
MLDGIPSPLLVVGDALLRKAKTPTTAGIRLQHARLCNTNSTQITLIVMIFMDLN